MLGSKLERGYYWYNDEYMYFSFNGDHSSKYHLFIQNNKELTIENSVGAASEYSNAIMQEGTYYLGTSRKQKVFKRKCAAELNNMQDYRRMMKWLTVGTVGELVFDSDRYWGWTVVLDSVGDASFVKNNNLLCVDFEITFKTVGTYLAHSIYPATWISHKMVDDGQQIAYVTNNDAYLDVIGTNQYNIPTIFATQKLIDNGDENGIEIEFYVLDLGNEKQNITLLLDASNNPVKGACELKIEHDGQEYLYASFADPDNNALFSSFEYDSAKSTLYVNDRIAEDSQYCQLTRQNNGILKLNSSEPIELYTTNISINTAKNKISIDLDNDSLNELQSNSFDYVCLSNGITNYTLYSESDFHERGDYYGDSTSYLGILGGAVLSNHIGNYTVSNNTVTINITKDSTISVNNNYKVYCGYFKKIKLTLINNEITSEIPHIAIATSYNNL